jgi:small subunit ribosomal protein S20
MANIKSAEKRIRTSAKRRARNKSVSSHLRKVVKKQRTENPAEGLPSSYSEIDRARSKGVIKKNTAARLKSRLAKAAGKKS